jgi:ATP-dependent helicase HrpA
LSRHLMIEQGLVEGHIEPKPAFLLHNTELAEELDRLQAKVRRRDLLVSDFSRYGFYDCRIPPDVYDGATLNKWLKANPHALNMTKSDLLREGVGELGEERFPDKLCVQHLELPLDYQYEPGSQQDGVTLDVPVEVLNQVAPDPLGWLVPGLIEEKVLALIRSLPKSLRTRFVPAPETAKQVVPMLHFGEGNICAAVAAALSHLGGVSVPADAFQEGRLPTELRMNIRVTDAEGKLLAANRDLEAIRTQLGQKAAESFSQADDPRWNRDGLTGWDFDELPAEIELSRGRLTVKAYPALLDRDGSVSLRLVDSQRRAEDETRLGLRRLCLLSSHRELKSQVDWLPNIDKMNLYAKTLPGFDLREQLMALLADCAMIAGQPTPRTKEEFERFLAAGRERIAWGVQELIAIASPLFEGYHQAILAVEGICASAGKKDAPVLRGVPVMRNRANDAAAAPRWQYAIDDIRQQISLLMDAQSFSKTPWEWLRQYPRYFRAICARVENLPGGVPRDLEKYQEFQPRWQLYLDQARHKQAQGVFDSELQHLRWMLEEYRVSLFAQKLGTAIPVSPKRLDQQWAKVRA